VLCDVNVTTGVLANLQTKLKREGVYKGAITGTLTPATQEAVNAYARGHKLPYGPNFIGMDVMKSLGLAS
jgi:peptidoglycan hydrolase-like protein with peptidoglycan-binding domain